jgi:hypothetical protein
MKKFLTASAGLMFLALALSGCFFPGYGYGHGGWGGGWGGGYHNGGGGGYHNGYDH